MAHNCDIFKLLFNQVFFYLVLFIYIFWINYWIFLEKKKTSLINEQDQPWYEMIVTTMGYKDE